MIDNEFGLDELQYLMKFQYLMKVEEDEPDKKKITSGYRNRRKK